MERRVLIAIFLSFLVLYLYQALVVKPTPAPASATVAPSTAVPAGGAVQPGGTAPTPTTPANADAAAPQATPLVGDTTERDVRIETGDVIAVFTNKGARLKSWRLKRYLDPQKQPQELIPQDVPNQPLPFTLRTKDERVNATINWALYTVSGVPAAPIDGAPTELRFEYTDSAGIHAVKTFHLDPASFVITFGAAVSHEQRALPAAILWGPAVADNGEVSSYIQTAQGMLYVNGGVERLARDDLAEQPTHEGEFRYAGVDDNYFMAVALTPGPSKVVYQPLSIPPPAGSEAAERPLVAFEIEPQQNGAPVKFFVGPKDFDVLASIDRDLTHAIHFGYFAVIVVPLLKSLKWVNGYVGNYGWSIVILTIIINAIMFPLRHKSAVSMRKMQDIQPEIKTIQERYKKLKATDPAKQKMNQEMMALYRERGVNPAGGCVPMLLTFPLIFAFYALLSTAVELRGAPFFGWIHDLTAHDPYFITPVLMGASQVWQQRMMPMTGVDPAQQKMMMFMPVVFMFMFLWAPSGLAVYWFISNLWTIGQQYLTNYLLGPPNVRSIRPAAERRVKRVGGGKTEAAAREQ